MARYPKEVALEELEISRARKRGRESYILVIRGDIVELPTRACQLLKELIAHQGRMLRRESLIESLGIGGKRKDQSLNENVHQLKMALRAHRVQAMVATAEEVGYVLCTFA